ncbi:MAG: hypothetical protein JWM28_3934 [Chitinophagaceae bacterium]|nr:hypothetical protein [Chitinophagaceae bacterium]
MEISLNSNSKTARQAASLFFFLGMPLSLWGQTYILSKIFVRQDPAATASNLLSNEFLFRLSIFSHLADTLFFVLMILLFYSLFRRVDKHLARIMLVSAIAQIAVVFVLELFNFTALMILKTEVRPTFDVVQQQEVAYFLLRIHANGAGIGMGKLFVGLCFLPFGMLVFRSGYAPRIIGVLLIIGGIGYVADCSTAILLQRADYLMVRSFLMYTTLAYILALLWFLVKGVREPGSINSNNK